MTVRKKYSTIYRVHAREQDADNTQQGEARKMAGEISIKQELERG
jgi:hypothetical protein